MEQEYTISTGMKILYGSIATGAFVFSIVLFNMPNHSGGQAVLLIPFLFLAGSVLIIINLFKRKVIITDDSITNINVFSKKELLLSDIKGCRVGQKVISLEPVSSEQSKITISNYIDLKDNDLLASWVRGNFKDLDAADLKAEKEALLQNTDLGFTEEDRAAKLKKVKEITVLYNLVGLVVGFGAIFFDNTKPIVILLMCYPLLGVILMAFSKGLMKFLSNNKRSVYGFTLLGVILPGFILFIKSLSEYSLLTNDHLWLPLILMAAIIFTCLYLTGINRSVESVKGQIIVMLFAAFIYGFGSVRQINCTFDNTEPQIYNAVVLGHSISHGKSTSYFFTLSPWGPIQEQKQVEVSRHLYQDTYVGDTVKMNYRPGLLNIPWFVITKR